MVSIDLRMYIKVFTMWRSLEKSILLNYFNLHHHLLQMPTIAHQFNT